MSMVKPSVSIDRSVSVGALFRPRSPSMGARLLSVLLVVFSAGRALSFSHGVTGTKLSAVGKGNIATIAALSVATSKTIVGAFTKIPQGKFAVSAVLSAGTLLFSADQVKADNGGYGTCYSTNYPGTDCKDVEVQGCDQKQTNSNCCNGSSTYNPCDGTCHSDIGCCSCNDEGACAFSSNAVFYDGVCNGQNACAVCDNIIVYSGSCNNDTSCYGSPYLTVGSGSCNGKGSCQYCCGNYVNDDDTYGVPCNAVDNGDITIPDNVCNDPASIFNTETTTFLYPSCPWCPNCANADGTSCYNTLLTGQASLSDAGITDRRILQKKLSKQKAKKSKRTPMNCVSAKEKIVSYFQAKDIPKLRSKYTIVELAKSSDKGHHRKRSHDCNVELSWLFEHLEGQQLVQACAELENQKTKLQAYLGNHWTIENLKCNPEDKNKIR